MPILSTQRFALVELARVHNMKKLISIVFLILLSPVYSWAACSWSGNTGTATSVSEVNACITDAASKTGAVIIQIPNGTYDFSGTATTVDMTSWTTPTSLIIRGQNDCTMTNNPSPLFDYPTSCGTNVGNFNLTYVGLEGIDFRLAHMRLTGTSGVSVSGNGKSWRFDHLFFDTVTSWLSSRVFWFTKSTTTGLAEGLIDHNYFLNPAWGSLVHYQGTSTTAGGNYEWINNPELGTSHAVYLENNKFYSSTSGYYLADNNGASKWVWRYNHITNGYVNGHDFTSASYDGRGGRKVEIYENTFVHTGGAGAIIARPAANGVIYNNTTTATESIYVWFISLKLWRSDCASTTGKSYLATTSTYPQACSSGTGCINIDGSGSPDGYPCRDQAGVSGNDPQVGGGMPFLVWNNTYNGTRITAENGVQGDSWVVLNQDYCVGETTKPATCNGVTTSTYWPGAYTYPHPLTGQVEPDTTPPVRSALSPSGAQECDAETPVDIVLSLTTNEPATCKGSPTDEAYADLDWTFDGTGTTSHSKTLSLACDASYTYYVRCQDDESSPNVNPASSVITFTINPTAADETAPTLAVANPLVLSADGRTLTLTFNESVKFGAGGNGGVTITPSGGAATVSYASEQYSTALVYTTSRVILSTETLTTTYTQPTNGIEDNAGNDLVTFNTQATTNNSTQVPDVPVIAGAKKLWADDVTVGGDAGDGQPLELGVRFQSSVAGVITAIRFYKQASNTGTHVGNVWTADGVNKGTVNFSGESATGWQQQSFSSPIHVAANTQYVASVFMPAGYWSGTTNYFGSTGVANSPLSSPQSVENSYNGLYLYTATSSFPYVGSNAHRNYWIDIVFEQRAITTIGGGTHSISTDGSSSLTW